MLLIVMTLTIILLGTGNSQLSPVQNISVSLSSAWRLSVDGNYMIAGAHWSGFVKILHRENEFDLWKVVVEMAGPSHFGDRVGVSGTTFYVQENGKVSIYKALRTGVIVSTQNLSSSSLEAATLLHGNDMFISSGSGLNVYTRPDASSPFVFRQDVVPPLNTGAPTTWATTAVTNDDGWLIFSSATRLRGKSGTVFVFEKCKSSGMYVFRQSLAMPCADPNVEDQFGYSLALDKNTLVVGAPNVGTTKGAVFVYERDLESTTLRFVLKLPAPLLSSTRTRDYLGETVAVSGDYLFGGGSDWGNLFLMSRQNGVWNVNNSWSFSGSSGYLGKYSVMEGNDLYLTAYNSFPNSIFHYRLSSSC